jgi:transposase-like protein
MSGTKGMTHYSLAIKLQAVDLHEQEGMPYAQVADQLGIRKAERIEKWCRAYRREGELAFQKPIGRPRKDEPEQVTLARLRMENTLLKKFRSELHRTMLARRNIGSSNITEEPTW